ncbi:hypothetical protein MKW94_009924, partial [Papaver nudicaule]|nr:hypothetical protein [Papaver nudicaule]
MTNLCLQPLCKASNSIIFSTFLGYPQNHIHRNPFTKTRESKCASASGRRYVRDRKKSVICGFLLPVDPWAPTNIDTQSIASQLFAASLFPYLGFLYFITKIKNCSKTHSVWILFLTCFCWCH